LRSIVNVDVVKIEKDVVDGTDRGLWLVVAIVDKDVVGKD
jgi:hypothetical protein